MKKITRIYELILRGYGRRRRPFSRDAVGELVKTVLSQNTSDSNSERAYESLKKRFRSWDNLLEARPSRIASVIRSGGLANMKARRIKKILKEIKRRQGRLSLSALRRMKVDEAFDYLLSLDGIGPKTASVVLLFCFNKPLMPVDTHIFRVAKRIGLIANGTGIAEAHRLLTETTPDKLIADVHIGLIEHGRRVCRAERPLCDKCMIRRYCDSRGH